MHDLLRVLAGIEFADDLRVDALVVEINADWFREKDLPILERRDLFFTAALIREQSGGLTEAQTLIEQALVYSTAWLENQTTPDHQATHREIETVSARILNACLE